LISASPRQGGVTSFDPVRALAVTSGKRSALLRDAPHDHGRELHGRELSWAHGSWAGAKGAGMNRASGRRR